jgi:adenine deaminase
MTKDIIKGVVVDPVKREMKGVEISIQNGTVVDIKSNPNIKSPFILPGFIDAHIHIESTMMIPSKFAELAVKHGTVAVVTDPHEVANVAGVDGINFMINNSKQVPLRFFFGVPSCVPASPMEKSGFVLDSKIVSELISKQDFYFLAEMMNYPGVVSEDIEVGKKLLSAKNSNKPIDGHAPGLKDDKLEKYVNSGISTDHECSTLEEAKQKIALGMKVQIREGSAAKNFETLSELITDYSNSLMFCTDDCHPDYLEKGHINKIVARAISKGFNIYDVLQIACINPIKHYNLPVSPIHVGCKASFVVVNNLVDFNIQETYIEGQKVFDGTKLLFSTTNSARPFFPFIDSHQKGNIEVKSEGKLINVIGAIEGELVTKWLVEDLKIEKGEKVNANPTKDLLKIVLLDRYTNSTPVVAFIKGFGLKRGAIASSVAHDSHHIIAIGADDTSIDNALEWVVEKKGGLCFANEDVVRGIALPYFGLMTDDNCEIIAEQYKSLNDLVKDSGSNLASPFMTASFMALTVIPELKINHSGLFDVGKFCSTPLFRMT